MKKLSSVLLALVLVFAFGFAAFAGSAADEGSFGAYEHVFILGVDGAGRFFKDIDTPNFDRMFENGAVKYDARAEVKTDSGPNWGAILTGASIFKTGLQNGVTGEAERTSETDFPTVFTYLRKAHPDAVLASFVHWNNINNGIIETDVDVYKFDVGSDDGVTDAICEYLDSGNAPELMFVQLDDVDGAGHGYGSKSDEYFEAIKVADAQLGRIYDSIVANGLLDTSLIIVTADHGHTLTGGHGGITLRESQVMIAIAGKTVVAGGKLDAGTRNRDIADIALYALGVETPDTMTARVPSNLFAGVNGESRPGAKDLADALISAFVWPLTLITGIFGA
ncbi:MAG: alkaline phosphatase [Clostridia bacterium]|nr:alkaline phosphatase [Clostridia bacterium]